jgi:hypothetical protein
LQQEIIEKFPIGSSARKLKQDLHEQGFKLIKDKDCLTYHRLCFIGDVYYTISWQTDEEGKIYDLSVSIRSIFV